MLTKTRDYMLYKSKVEYADWAMTHVAGCAHGCNFPCFACNDAIRRGRVKSVAEWREPVLVANTLELLDKQIPRLRDKIDTVFLCFTTDPSLQTMAQVFRHYGLYLTPEDLMGMASPPELPATNTYPLRKTI